MLQRVLWIAVVILLITSILEIWYPKTIHEGFEQLISVGDSAFWASKIPRRGDVGFSEEDPGYIRDDRYFNGYADVQRLGVDHDFCRMVVKKSDQSDTFFACALGGTDGLSSIHYRTKSTREGFQLSRDDYMTQLDDGRDAYCRILKVGSNTFEARCNEADDTKFRDKLTIDASPPENIKLLLRAYEGITIWLRLRDDIVDYAKNLIVAKAGGITIEEAPPALPSEPARTLSFNGIDQYLRIGDNKDLEFGNTIELRYMRAISFWVYFDEFTNNAHIFDFGNGAGKDNVWCGIVGRGNSQVGEDPIRDLVCGHQESTVPRPPSGAQPATIVTPKELMLTTQANVDEFTCPYPELYGRIMPQTQPHVTPPKMAKSADLVYEIWDRKQRKMHIQIKNAIPLRKWVHITITARNTDAFRPDLDFYRNGELYYTEKAAWLPQENVTLNNYIGKSNWATVTKPYENADELFKGKLFDFRTYNTLMSEGKVKETYNWGKGMIPTEED